MTQGRSNAKVSAGNLPPPPPVAEAGAGAGAGAGDEDAGGASDDGGGVAALAASARSLRSFSSFVGFVAGVVVVGGAGCMLYAHRESVSEWCASAASSLGFRRTNNKEHRMFVELEDF